MSNQIPLQDDIQFWGQQVTEHASFMNLLLEEPILKNEALMMQGSWEEIIPSQNPELIVGMLNQTIPWKQNVLQRLRSGEWLGWALPSFVEHITFEEQYFLARLTNGTSAQDDINSFVKIVKEHAAVVPKFIDITNPDISLQSENLAKILEGLQQTCSTLGPECKIYSGRSFALADQFFSRVVPTSMNIIPPTLAAHIVREGQRGMLISSLL